MLLLSRQATRVLVALSVLTLAACAEAAPALDGAAGPPDSGATAATAEATALSTRADEPGTSRPTGRATTTTSAPRTTDTGPSAPAKQNTPTPGSSKAGPYAKPSSFWQPFRSPVIYIDSGRTASTQLAEADTVVVGRIVRTFPDDAPNSRDVHAQIETASGDKVVIGLLGGLWSDEVSKFLPTDEAVFILKSPDEYVHAPDTHRCLDQPSCIVLFSEGGTSLPLADGELRDAKPTTLTAEEYAQQVRQTIAQRSSPAPATS